MIIARPPLTDLRGGGSWHLRYIPYIRSAHGWGAKVSVLYELFCLSLGPVEGKDEL